MNIFKHSIFLEKAEKSVIDAEVKHLLQLKADFKNLTGKDWKPDMAPVTETNSCSKEISGKGDNSKEALTTKITEQGNIVRDLKAKKAGKVSCTLNTFYQVILLID